MDLSINDNIKWLIDVSREMIPGLQAIVNDHIQTGVPVIIEGDFLYPEFTVSFDNPKVKSFYVYEPDRKQILQNYLAREGGELQHYRADVSTEYGKWLMTACEKLGIGIIESRPWNTAIDRVIENMQ